MLPLGLFPPVREILENKFTIIIYIILLFLVVVHSQNNHTQTDEGGERDGEEESCTSGCEGILTPPKKLALKLNFSLSHPFTTCVCWGCKGGMGDGDPQCSTTLFLLSKRMKSQSQFGLIPEPRDEIGYKDSCL